MIQVALALFGFAIVVGLIMFVVGLQFEPLMHRHKWIQVERCPVYQTFSNGKTSSRPYQTVYINRCETCGKMKKWRL
jgi:hypothetical protein